MNLFFRKFKTLLNLKFEETILEIKRVTKIASGGKSISFKVIVVVGDKKSRVGLGTGKGKTVHLAIQKAILNAKKNIIHIPITKNLSIPHIIYGKYESSKIMLLPAKKGTGIITGGVLRAILEAAGITNVTGKQFGSSNVLNNARATINALINLKNKIIILKELDLKRSLFYKKILLQYKIKQQKRKIKNFYESKTIS